MVKRRFHCKLCQVIETFTEFRYWKWAAGVEVRLQETKTRSVQERQKGEAVEQGLEHGEPMFAPKAC